MSAAVSSRWSLAQPPSQRKLGLVDAPRVESFDVKYRPRHLAEVLGQPAVVAELSAFVQSPYPRAFLFAGPTGVGKTSAAHALAGALGVDMAWNFHWIKSGTLDLAETEHTLEGFRVCPWGGGWRLVLVDEADTMTPRARELWLSILENIPANTVIVFTTNKPEKFAQRNLDRFKRFDFVSTGPTALDAAQALCDTIWQAETGGADGPDVARLPNALIGGEISYRRIVGALESLIRFGAPLCPVPSTAPVVAHIPPASATLAPDATDSASLAETPKPRVSRAKSVPGDARAWWNGLSPAQRTSALKSVPLATIPYAKVQERVAELVRRAAPPEYDRFLNIQPVILTAHQIASAS